jgi:hypothetical protein
MRRELLYGWARYHLGHYGASALDAESNVIEAVFHERSKGGAA